MQVIWSHFWSSFEQIFQKYLHFHHILGFATLSLGISLIWFSYADTDFTRGISIFISCIFCAQVNIFEHICIIETFKRDNLDAWLQINHGAFGVGGLLGPYIVYVFEERSFVVIGIICLATTLPYFKLRSPGQSEEKLL